MGKIKKATRKFFRRQQHTKATQKPQRAVKPGKGRHGRHGGKNEKSEQCDSRAPLDDVAEPVAKIAVHIPAAESSEFTRAGLEHLWAKTIDKPPATSLSQGESQEILVRHGARRHGDDVIVTSEVTRSLLLAAACTGDSALPVLADIFAVAVQTVLLNDIKCGAASSLGVVMADAQVIQGTIETCVTGLPALFDTWLDITPQAQAAKRPAMPSRCKTWPMVHHTVHVACHAMVSLGSMWSDVLGALLPYVSYLACFEHLRGKVFKVCYGAISRGSEFAAKQGYAVLKAMSVLVPYPTASWCIRTMYWAYVERCQAMSQAFITELAECMRELCTLDGHLAYQHAFVYVRDMALTAHAALRTADTEARPVMFSNWSFVSQLRLWSFVVGSFTGSGDLKEPSLSALAYPLIQLATNAAKLAKGRRLLPSRMHCGRALVSLATAGNVYVPMSPLILEALDSGMFYARPRQSEEPTPPLDTMLEAEANVILFQQYRESVLASLLALLLDHFKGRQDDAAYPECAQISISKLKKFAQDVKEPHLAKMSKALLDKVCGV